MSKDLEETLEELGPEYRAMVARLRAVPEVEPSGAKVFKPNPFKRADGILYWGKCLIAASIVAAFGMSALFIAARAPEKGMRVHDANMRASSQYTLAFARADSGSIEEIVRTQRADGSWSNDFLTQQNAAALRDVASASVAYRKATRYLRTKGLAPLSDDELRLRSQTATASI